MNHELHTLDDPRLDAYVRLTEAQLRNKLEPEKGIFIAESFKVIERALAAGYCPQSMLLTPHWLEAAQDVIAKAQAVFAAHAHEYGETPERIAEGLPVFVLPPEQVEMMTGFNLTRGILAAMHRPKLPEVEELLPALRNGEGARRIAVLEGIVDHTNVGAIFRSAAALNVDAVLVTPTCCDPLYRRAVRVSMGTVFQVPWTRIGDTVDDWPATGLARLQALGFKTAALALSDDSISLDAPELAACDKLALVFGTEGDGLSHTTIEGCDFTVKIPMAHGVDSLNVAAASAVTFWELCR